MSTRVGTLQAPRANGSILLAAFLGLLVMASIAVVATSIERDQGQQGETTFVGRHVVNTPSEQSAAVVGGAEQTFVGGTAANTPSELKPVYMHGRNLQGLSALEPVYMHGRNLRGLSPLSETGTNTPTELTGGIVGGLPTEFYDRHQRA
jgi:hypothetical protein